MPYTRTFEGFAPPRRYDGEPFTLVNIREAATESGAYTTIDTITLTPVDADPEDPQLRNLTTGEAALDNGWYILRWEDADGSVFDSDPIDYDDEVTSGPDDINIITLAEYKTAESISVSTYDTSISQLITQVSAAIRRLTGRDFGMGAASEERVFEYRGGGVLDIDDANAIMSVTMEGRALAQDRDYRPQRDSDTPYFYLDMYVEPGLNASPEMGFTRNEDTYSGRVTRSRSALVTVEAEFGWRPVPEDVKLAAIEMLRVVADLPKDDLQNESIAEYSYSTVPDQFNSGRWPTRAVDLLRPYKRINL